MAVTVEMHHTGERGVAAAEKATADVRAAGRTRDPKSHQASMCGVAVCRRRRRLHESCKRHPPDHTTGPISPRPSTRVPPAESARVSRLPFAPSSTALAASSWLYLAHRRPVRPNSLKTPILGRVTHRHRAARPGSRGQCRNQNCSPRITITKQHTPVRAFGVACSRPSQHTDLAREEVRAMEGGQTPQSRPYWIRYVVALWAGEKLKWARDNVLIACVCSLAPGLIAAGISAALSDHKWRAATYATLLTYGGLFALFLMWRLVATPWELDRERQRFIDGLTQKLAYTRLELVVIRASPPAIDVEILEIHVQAADTTLSTHALDLPVACNIFLRVKLTLRDTRPIGVLAYELSSVLHGNSSRADFVDDIQDWGLVTEKKAIGVGTTFHYTVVRLTKLAHELEERGVPVEGWLHFSVTGVYEREIGATIYRLIVLTPNGGISAEIAGTKNLAGLAGSQFQKIPDASHVLYD